MSNLTQFAPFASGGLKSFQTGFAAGLTSASGVGEDGGYFDVTISSVNTSKAIPGGFGGAGASSGADLRNLVYSNPNSMSILMRLTSSTNLRLSGLSNTYGVYGINARWQVAEAN
jgi:hypothetical protein